MVNPFTFLYNVFDLLVNMATILYNFLFQEIEIGTIKVIPLFAIGGVIMITLIIARLIKQFVPLA